MPVEVLLDGSICLAEIVAGDAGRDMVWNVHADVVA